MTVAHRSAVLILGGTHAALVAARDLSRAGSRVGVARHRGDSAIATRSRHVDSVHVIADPQMDLEGFAADIAGVVDREAYEVVLPTADDYLAGLATTRDRIPAAVPLARLASVLAILDKIDIEPYAIGAGFRVPHTTEATTDAIEAWTGPAVVKDRSHWRRGRTEAGRGPSAFTVDREQMLRVAMAIRRHGGRPTLQVPVTGRMHCVTAFRNPSGTVSGWVEQTSDHLWPLPMGTTSRASTTPPDGALRDRVRRLLDDLSWIGMANLQLFRQPDGSDVLLDFNGRVNHSLALSVASGVHYAPAWAGIGVGDDDVVLPDGRVGARVSFLVPDLKRAFWQREGGLVPDVARTLGFALRADHSVLSVRDPAPGLRYVAEAVLRRRPDRRVRPWRARRLDATGL